MDNIYGSALSTTIAVLTLGEPSDEARERLDDAFRSWQADNGSALELGGTGDTYALLLALLSAASQKI